jgi:transformation/transcription domain-associated protein
MQPQASPATPWDHIEEVMAILKTAYPLLALTMETMVDQILARLKPTTDEDIYRLIVALLNDGVQMYLTHLSKYPDTGGPLSQATETSLNRFAESMVPNHIKYKEAFEKDFITSKPNLSQLVERFRVWRDKLEILLDTRPQKHNLEHFTQYLAEFEHSKFDDIEVPGQYFQMKNSSKDFARIERFDPIADVVRAHAGCHRRIMIKGHDGSKHSFIIQHPAAKQYRREERTVQLFRLLNETLERRIETRRKNLHFNLPVIIPLAPQIRLVQDDRSNINLQDIFEDHARRNGFGKDDPSVYYINRMKEACLAQDLTKKSV